MHNFHPEAKTKTDIEVNPRAIERGLNCAVYQHFIRGSDLIPDPILPGSATISIASAGNFYCAVHEYDDATDERASIVVRRPERWLSGIVRIKGFIYTGNTIGNTFLNVIEMNSYSRNVILNTPVSSSGAMFITPPGPTIAQEFEYYNATIINQNVVSINRSIDFLSISFRRIGNNVPFDTNNGLFYLVGIDLEYTEKERFIGEDYTAPVYY